MARLRDGDGGGGGDRDAGTAARRDTALLLVTLTRHLPCVFHRSVGFAVGESVDCMAVPQSTRPVCPSAFPQKLTGALLRHLRWLHVVQPPYLSPTAMRASGLALSLPRSTTRRTVRENHNWGCPCSWVGWGSSSDGLLHPWWSGKSWNRTQATRRGPEERRTGR